MLRVWLLAVTALAVLVTAAPALAERDIAKIIAHRKALAEAKPYESVVPRVKEPVGEITLLGLWPQENEMRIALGALQGLVNRDQPRLYIGLDKPFRRMEYYGGKIWMKDAGAGHLGDPWVVFDEFKDYVKGLVIYDGTIDALASIAVTYAGLEDLIPADADLAEKFSERYGWKVVHDLRGRWTNRTDAYTWAFENLSPRCNKYALMHYNFGYWVNDKNKVAPELLNYGKGGFEADYAVAFQMFTWHMPWEYTDADLKLAERVMESVALHSPVFGGSNSGDVYVEPAYVVFVSKYANLGIPTGTGNFTMLSGVQLPPEMLKQKPRPVVRDMGPDKIYIAFTNSEHDNLEHVIGGGMPWHRLCFETDDPYRMWWNDPKRGSIPIGWPIGPLIADLAPATMAHFTQTATENDYFLAALAGISLTEPGEYGAAYPEFHSELLDEYCRITGVYMERLGWTHAQPVGEPRVLRHFVNNIPNLDGLMEGYGMRKEMGYHKANYLLDGVAVFHAMTSGTFGTGRERGLAEDNERKAKAYADQILNTKIDGRPGFIHGWTVGWDFGPTTLRMTADLLPEEYVIVRPDELAALYRKYMGSDAELAATRPQITASGTVKETPSGRDGLILDTGKVKVEIGWGNQAQPPIKRIMGVDGKWRGGGELSSDAKNPIKSFTSRKTRDTASEKEYTLTYTFADNQTRVMKITAYGGNPFVVVEEQSGSDLPSWRLDLYKDLEPHVYWTDNRTWQLTYDKFEAMGSFPWYHWGFTCKTSGPERDMIGVVNISRCDWTGGGASFGQRTPGGMIEFFGGRPGTRKFAVAALDRQDEGAQQRLWNQLNTK